MKKRITILFMALFMLFAAAGSAFAQPQPTLAIDGNLYVKALKGLQNKVPAIMYHKVTDNPAEVTPYVVTSEMLAQDFAEIKSRGYTPITVGDFYYIKKLSKNLFAGNGYKLVAEFFDKYPKPIIITFDDGYKGIYTNALPLMREYGFKADFFICGELIDAENPEYCTWGEIKELADSGLAEIGNHTYALHNLSREELAAEYAVNQGGSVTDIVKNKAEIAEKTGAAASVFSFPYGLYDYSLVASLKNAGITALVSTDYRVNMFNDGYAVLGRFNRDTEYSSKDFFDIVDIKCK